MQMTEYFIDETKEEEIDVSVYMGSCNNPQVMFHMVPDEEPEQELIAN